ncbi:MAG TPA: GntR family transcriptional regulator, partial [Bacillota bacterium]|nr:GntR family transcriptional regulator [Bacillota bacterium]
MVIEIDKSSLLPIIRQIYLQIRAAILEGRLSAGEKVPSTRELALRLGVSRNVVLE